MKQHTLSRALSSFCLLFMMLVSLSVSAARLEVDRGELLIGETTSVHLKGTPFIAVVDWKVGPELEIVESDSKRALVRAKRAGTGTVTCEMNLKTYTLNIAVRGNAAAATPAAPIAVPVQTATPPVYSTPSYPTLTPGAAPQQTNLAGTWQINAAGYQGKLELSSTQGMLIGRVWFDAHAIWEPLEDLYFDEAIRELSFTRQGASQSYRGRLQGNTLEGMFTQWSGRDYSANAPSYPWSATRSGTTATTAATAATMPAMREPRIAELTWQGMNEDKVGDFGNGRPNGTLDGHLRLTLDLPDRQAISSISLWSANEKGDKAGGQIWHSQQGSYWMLGVFRDGRQLNTSHVPSLGEYDGRIVLDLYANSSGWFNPNQWFLVEVSLRSGKTISRTLILGAVQPSNVNGASGAGNISLNLDKTHFAPGESVMVRFTAPANWPENAWVGIIPASIPHGSESVNDQHDISYQYLNKRTTGSLTFIAPSTPGNWDFRLHDTDNGGKEFASVTFSVGEGITSPGGRDYTGQVPTTEKSTVLFDNGNIAGVENGPSQPTTFSLSTAHVITLIQDYHWNNARGATPGNIGLRDTGGRVFGPWLSVGSPGQGGVPNAYWTARPEVTLPAGTYTVLDSHPASWSRNGSSQQRGFTRVEGYPTGYSQAPDIGKAKPSMKDQADPMLDALKQLKGLFGK